MRKLRLVVLVGIVCFTVVVSAFAAEQQRRQPTVKTLPKPVVSALKPSVSPSWLLQAPAGVQPDFYLDFSDKDLLKDVKQVVAHLDPLIAMFIQRGQPTDFAVKKALEAAGKGFEALLKNARRLGILTFRVSGEALQAVKAKQADLVAAKWRNVLMVRTGNFELWLYAWGDRQGLFAIVDLRMANRLIYAQVDGFLEVGECASQLLQTLPQLITIFQPPKPKAPERQPPAPDVNLTGTWVLTIQTPDGERRMTLMWQQAPNGDLSGEAKAEQAQVKFLGGFVSGKTVQFSVEVTAEGQTFKVDAQGEVKDNGMSGTMTTPFGSVSWSATRQKGEGQ